MKIYLIRHAQSEYNIGEEEIAKQIGPDYLEHAKYLEHKYNPALYDCGITPLGIQQCLKAAEYMHDKPIDVVVVSPFRRALLTCHYIFKDHPSKPRIVVDGLFREFFDSVCDIASRLPECMQQFPHFDYSLIKNPENWYLECEFFNPEAKLRIMQHLQKHPEQERSKRSAQVFLTVMKEFRQEKKILDPHETMIHRHKRQVEQIKKLFKGQRVAVVSHSENLKYFVGVKIANCEVREYDIQDQ